MANSISVIIPSLNAAQFIRAAIDSVLRQTHPAAEVIVVDGGSSDGTQEIVSSYGPPVTLVDLRPYGRKGISAGRNVGLEKATGDWIAYLDADDWWAPEMNAARLEELEKHPEAVLCYTGRWMVDSETGDVRPAGAAPAERIWPALRWQNQIATSTVMMKRAAAVEERGFREDLPVCEDWEFWVRLRRRFPFVSVLRPLMYYRISPHSASRNITEHMHSVGLASESLTEGVGAGKRWLYRRYLWATQWRGVAIVARELRRMPQHRALALRSLLNWPFPTLLPDRYWMLVRSVLPNGMAARCAAIVRRSKAA